MGSWIAQYLDPVLTPADATATKLPRQLKGRPQPTIGPRTPGNYTPNAADKTAAFLESPVTGTAVPPLGIAQLLTDAAKKVYRGNYKGAAGTAAALAAAPLLGIPGRLLGKGAQNAERFAVLTAENAGGHAMSAAENTARNASLEAELASRGYKYSPVKGRYKDPTTGEVLSENSYLVHGLGEREAKLIGKRYGQNGVITQHGYHDLVDGKFFPSSGTAEASDLPYTQLPNGKRFTLNIDWANPQTPKVNALPVPKNANPEVLRVADELRQGKDVANLPRVAKADPRAGKLMADAYDRLPKNDPNAKAAYDQLNAEVAAQYKALEGAGYKFEYTDSDPYKSSKEMMADVQQNRRLKVFKTQGDQTHPYMTNEQNDKFRAVHDMLAHAGEGHQFGPTGEENAYRVHASTLSPLAQRALATETRGQNSWVNFGPNANLPAAARPFAEQKAALFPQGMLGGYDEIQQPSVEALGSVGVRPKGFGPAYPTPPSTSFSPSLPSMLDEAAAGPHPTSDAARASARPLPSDMEIPAGIKRAATDSVIARGAPAVLTAPNSGNVFDTSKLGLDVPAGVNTQRPPLKRPVRADLSSLKNVPRKMREVYTPNVEKAMRETPEAAGWYDMSQVRDAMKDLSPTGEDDFKKLMLFMGPTSIGTKVPDNLRQASKFFQLWKNGELSLDDLKNGTLDLPQGFSNRRQKSVNAGIAKILENGNLDPYSTPKTFRYANQLAGDMWGGAALDMHVGRQVGQTGVSDTRPLLDIFNDKLRSTAQKYGFNSPMDAFTAFAQGKTPLWAMLPGAAMGGGLLYGNDQQR